MYDTRFLDLPALQSASGVVRLPGSKSISNRVLLLAALASGTTAVHDLLDSEDTRVMLGALAQLGCRLVRDGSVLHVQGLNAQLPVRQATLFLANAGTAMRPLTAALALLEGHFELSGVPRMHERPIGDLVDALNALGCHIDYLGHPGFPPLRIKPVSAAQLRLGQPIVVRGDVSSQFLTALLLTLPLASTHSPVSIEVQGELISKPYVEITLNLLARFGIEVQRDGWQRFVIPAGSRYRSPGTITIEADASSASYFIALGAIGAQAGRELCIEGVGHDSIQGDIRFVDAARMMGADISTSPNAMVVRRGAWPLRAIDLDANHIPDAAMTLAVMALYADGPSTLRNIASWRVKETDRIHAMATELRKLGANVETGNDFIRVSPIAPGQWRRAQIHTYDDHRVAMCFSLAAFNPQTQPVRILDPRCVVKTYPDYFETLFGLTQAPSVPVLCVDGPTASGKGTLAAELALRLGYHYLDSGALYRVAGLMMRQAQLVAETPEHQTAIADLVRSAPLRFIEGRIWLQNEDISDTIRTEAAGMDASRVSALPLVRAALHQLQLSFRRLPGLVADGRDMGTVIFPDAALKIYLTASATQRASRRHKQLISKGISATFGSLREALEARDARDTSRSVAPLKAAEDARLLDNSELSIEQSVEQVLDWWQQVQAFDAADHTDMQMSC